METYGLNGKKLSKNSLQIHLVGTIDELNAHIGLIKARMQEGKDKESLENIQIKLMKLMSHVSDLSNEKYFFSGAEAEELEIENTREFKFVLPGKTETDAFIHIARTVARRAERYFAAVNEDTPLCKNAASYLNKLSDYLFYLSKAGHDKGRPAN